VILDIQIREITAVASQHVPPVKILLGNAIAASPDIADSNKKRGDICASQ